MRVPTSLLPAAPFAAPSLATLSLATLSLAAPFIVACGGASPAAPATATAPTSAPSTQPATVGSETPPGEAGARDAELAALLTEVLTPQLCPRLLGSYVGLPGEGGETGPAAGRNPSVGRWWIRRCDAQIRDGHLALTLGGMGWTWVDRESSGFRVRQYLLVDMDAQLSVDLEVGYDRARRLATLWMRPPQGAAVSAHVTPRGLVTAEATGFFSSVIGGVLPVFGASPSELARAQVAEIGSTTLRERLGGGFTMTYAIDRRQADFMVGALSRGETPERPFDEPTTQPWSVNQRSRVWPGGLDVVGPIDASQAAQGLDIELEEGEGAVVRTVCAEPMERYFDQRLQAPTRAVAPPGGAPLVELTRTGVVQHVVLPRAPCPTLLLLAPRSGSALPVQLRYRVAPEGSAPRPAAITNPTSATDAHPGTAQSQSPARPRRVRIQLVGATVSAQNAAGRDWDVVGGEADVYLTTASVPLAREIDRTPVDENANTVRWDRWLPGAFDPQVDLPLRFSLFDEDATLDELVGTVDLDGASLPATTSEVALPVRTTGAVPRQLGTLRLRIEPLP